jgi:hypothetical protein
MHSTSTSHNEVPAAVLSASNEEIHAQAIQYISEANRLLFQELPELISQIIKQDIWDNRDYAYKNFGEYALASAPDGLGITNNDMLSLLKSAMNKKTQNAPQWAEVLCEVDTSVRSYAKEHKIPIQELRGTLSEYEAPHDEPMPEDVITYLPSRSRSHDGQLMKLKKKDPEAYEHVIQGKMGLKEAWPQTPRKKLQPIESVKNKFASLSKPDREAFLAWIEAEREHLE